MKIETRRLSDIKPYPNNPRKNDNAVDGVAESIKQCGYCAPIIVDENGIILAGHTRLKALKKLGWKEAEVVVRDGLSEEQKKKYRLLDNKTGESASWDVDALEKELEDMDFAGYDFGFEIEIEPDVVEDNYDKPAPKEPTSKLGDVYLLGRHRLMCGDSTDIAQVEKLVAEKTMDMLLTDPPYNVAYEGKAGKIANDDMGDGAFREFLTAAFYNAKAVMKEGAAFHIWHTDSEGYNVRGAVKDAGMLVRQCLIWVKNSLVLGRQDFQWKHEPCLYGENPARQATEISQAEGEDHQPCLYGWVDGTHYWFKNRKQTTVLYFDRPTVSKEHPTMKPIKLFDYEMQCNTHMGDSVLDLFGGSGTTIMAAEQNERTAYVMEYDPKYVDVIIDRWQSFTGKSAIRVND